MFEGFPPVTRPRMLEVGKEVLLTKLAVWFAGTPNSPKLWKRFGPLPGLVPPVMSKEVPCCVTVVFNPEDVMGDVAWA